MGDDFARQLAAGNVGPREIERLRKGCEAWLSARGVVSLERCLGLAATPAQMARDERDLHLLTAWRLVDGETPWKKSVTLAAELKTFLSRIWPLWRNADVPPQGCSDLRHHLFSAVRVANQAGIGMPETARQLHNIAKEAVK